MKTLFLLLLLLIPGCASGYMGRSDTPEFADATLVSYSEGGSPQVTRALLLMSDVIKVIDGPCYSACVLSVMFDNVCWTSRASFHIHGSTQNGFISEAGNAYNAAHLPIALRQKIKPRTGPNDWTDISAEEMSRITGKALCRVEA